MIVIQIALLLKINAQIQKQNVVNKEVRMDVNETILREAKPY